MTSASSTEQLFHKPSRFDRRVALGWLLADAAGLPLLDRPQAHALGIKAQRAASSAKAAIRDARRKAIAPARAAGADVSAAQDGGGSSATARRR